MCKIIAHRGYWKTKIEQNSIVALTNAAIQYDGFETDIRDFNEQLVVSHNIADKECTRLDCLLGKIMSSKTDTIMALNIKSDGLISILKDILKKYNIENYFAFDMSIPQQIEYLNAGLNVFARQSEFETNPTLYDKVQGIWMDGFCEDEWITQELIHEHIKNGKKVCVVSSELHNRKSFKSLWQRIKSCSIEKDDIYICTDYPDEAKEFFNED